MSFRFNLSRDINDRSFVSSANQLIAPSIGITGNRTTLSCRFNNDQKSFRYCKSDEEVLQTLTLVEKKLKRWAFSNIQRHTHYHREFTKSMFWPEQLANGNYSALTKFLGTLKTNRFNSYIKLNLKESQGTFSQAKTLLKPTIEIFKQRQEFGFNKLKKNMLEKNRVQSNNILMDIQMYSSIENRNSMSSVPEKPPKKGVVNVTYVSVKPSKIRESSQKQFPRSAGDVSSRSNRKSMTCIDLNELIESGRVREYQFKHVSNLSNPRILSERVISYSER